MSKVAPKTFNQLRLVLTAGAAFYGSIVGMKQKQANDQLWTAHYQQQWAAKAKIVNDEAAYQRSLQPETVPDIIPAELHAQYKEIKASL